MANLTPAQTALFNEYARLYSEPLLEFKKTVGRELIEELKQAWREDCAELELKAPQESDLAGISVLLPLMHLSTKQDSAGLLNSISRLIAVLVHRAEETWEERHSAVLLEAQELLTSMDSYSEEDDEGFEAARQAWLLNEKTWGFTDPADTALLGYLRIAPVYDFLLEGKKAQADSLMTTMLLSLLHK